MSSLTATTQPKLEKIKEYGFQGRIVWKKFISREDCLAEYQNWSNYLDLITYTFKNKLRSL